VKKKFAVLLITWLALICCNSAGLGQGRLSLVSYTKKAGVGYSVCVNNNYAYVANNDGIAIFDVHQPEHPQKIGRLPAGVTFGICVKNDAAYISAKGGLVVSDVSDPANPKIINEYTTDKETHRVQVDGSFAYIAANEGLEILDVDDPENITSAAHFSAGRAKGIAVSGGIAYLACHGSGVEVIDVTDPFSPKKVTSIAGTKGAWDVHIHGEYLYVGRHGAGIAIFNLSDKKSPRLIGSFRDDDGGEAQGVWGDGRYLYVADNYGVEVLDISDPGNPFEIGAYGKVKGAHDLYVEGTTIYVASASKGLMILQFEAEQR